MPDLSFEILAANPARDMISPAIAFDLHVTNPFPEQSIQGVLLRCQILIETVRRRYGSTEQEELRELFDEPARWGDTLRPMTWANTSANIPAFSSSTVYPLTVPCAFDFDTAATKYFCGITDGDIPLKFLFSGSVLYQLPESPLQIAPISWNKEASFRLAVQVWKDLMNLHYGNSVCLRLRRDVFEELHRFKRNAGFATFEETIERMLALAKQEEPVP